MRFRFASLLLSAAVLSSAAVAEEKSVSESDVRLQAVIAEGAKPLGDPVKWIVTKLAEKSGVPGEVVLTETAAAPKLRLAPGRYVVAAKYGDAAVREEIVVGPGKSNHVVNLDAGFMRLDMIPHAGAPAVTKNITWEVYRYAKGKGADETLKLATAVAPSHRFVLREGYYTVRARHDGTVADMVLNVVAGHQLSYTVNLYAGHVGLSAVAEEGALREDVVWEVLRAASDKKGQREVVATHVGKSPTLLLREGNYVVQARSGDLIGEAPLVIKAGNTQKIKVTLAADADG